MLPLPNNSDERGQERRPSLPSIRDLFPEHLLQPVKRPSPFSLYDLGSSLPNTSKSRSGSPTASEPLFTATSAFSSRSEWSQTSGSPTPVNRRSASSDMTRHFMTAPLDDKKHLTLPPIRLPPSPNSRRASVPLLYFPPNISRSRSHSEGLITNAIHYHQDVPAEARRRHTISSRSYRTTGSASHSRRSSLTNPYPARTASPPSYPSSPPSTASGDEAITKYGRKKTPARYQCEYCGRCFNRPSSLKIHNNTHTGEKPFVCSHPGCGRHFSVMSNMRRHARTHAPQDGQTDSQGGEHDTHDSSSTTSSVQSTPLIPQAPALSASPRPAPSLLSHSHSEANPYSYPRSYSRSRSRSPLSDSSAEP